MLECYRHSEVPFVMLKTFGEIKIKKARCRCVSTGSKEPRGGYVYDSVYACNHARNLRKLQKYFIPKCGKDAVHVSHTVKSVFSIVKWPQRGAAANLTI